MGDSCVVELAGQPLLLRPTEVGRLLRLTVGGVEELVRSGELHAVRVGKRWRIPRGSVERLVLGAGQDVVEVKVASVVGPEPVVLDYQAYADRALGLG